MLRVPSFRHANAPGRGMLTPDESVAVKKDGRACTLVGVSDIFFTFFIDLVIHVIWKGNESFLVKVFKIVDIALKCVAEQKKYPWNSWRSQIRLISKPVMKRRHFMKIFCLIGGGSDKLKNNLLVFDYWKSNATLQMLKIRIFSWHYSFNK